MVTEPHRDRCILTLNAGSSSLKFALFRADDPRARVLAGTFGRIGLPDARLTVAGAHASEESERSNQAPNHIACVPTLVALLEKRAGFTDVSAIGHRVVHGGIRYHEPQRVDAPMLDELRRISPFDPEHLPAEIALIEEFARRYPEVSQVACFDTAFHHDMPRVARLLAIPRRFEAQGIQRYGFHGLSYAYLLEELARVAGTKASQGRVILAHLGNGASLAAVRGGKSIDTSMGFTPTAGLVMSTRSGDLDPGLVSFLARSEQMTATQFQHLVNQESGLLGVSEFSSDMRDLLAREADDVRAAEAVALFCYQAKKWMGAFAAALGGLETLVFSGGIGENCPSIRARICEGLGFLGLELNESRNAAHADVISAEGSRATVRVIRTDEELMIARSVRRVLAPSGEKRV